MRKIFGSLAIAALFSGTAIGAGDYASFEELDTDEDGVITQQEATGSNLEQAFQKADIDSDKNVSQTEYDTYKQQQELKAEGPGGQQGGSQQGAAGGGAGGTSG